MLGYGKWEVVYYEDRRGRCPVEDFIESLPEKAQVKVFAYIELLEEKGPFLKRPYADLLEDEIYELRVRFGKGRYRIFYFFWSGNKIVLTHGITKKTSSVPPTEIERAKRYREDWLRRFEEAA